MNITLPEWLQQPVTSLTGVGPALESKLANLGIFTLQDCLFHLPYRYQDRTHIHPVGTLREGDTAVIEGNVVKAQVVLGRRRMLRVQIHDGSSAFHLRFFHFHPEQRAKLVPGLRIRCFGDVKRVNRELEMVHPEYILGEINAMPPLSDTLTPIYHLTDGVTQQTLRKIMVQALAWLHTHDCPDLLPSDLLSKYHFPTLKEALIYCHEPPVDADVNALMNGQHMAQQRLAFEELTAHQCHLLHHRATQQAEQAHACTKTSLAERLLKQVSFELTQAQQRVVREIREDMQTTLPMMRLLQGDVGSGKTIVAALAMCQAVESGCQAALMAPTDVLAEQHHATFKAWCEPLGINVAYLSGKLTAKTKKETYERIASGEAQIIIGTHALVQDGLHFHQLGLVIIDEQHRFGVHQRMTLTQKGGKENVRAHQLIMTATPIPRTLAMTAYADLDYSVIDELPQGRQPISTVVIGHDRRQDILTRVGAACAAGKQAYWVCTLIEESETLKAQAAEQTAEQLKAELPHVRIGLVHGKLKPSEKDAVMQAFNAGEVQLLVATTVIEVGVNVPNASLMIIENPERLGLSQLHQLRGRVGRGSEKSHCVLLYHPPLSETAGERLSIMRETNNGFEIAEKDLELRGPGEWLGTKQKGVAELKMANLLRDKHLLGKVKIAAESLHETYPERATLLIARWLGQNVEYSRA